MSQVTIAIVGRPNVGKSTLFNRLTKSRDALVADMPGLTRDRHYGILKFQRRQFLLIDTGGFEPLITDGILYKMAIQATQAIIESDVVMFLLDARTGVTPQDKVIAQKLRELDKRVYIVINKAEGMDKHVLQSEFYELGFADLYPISASHGEGTYPLLQAINSNFPAEVIVEEEAPCVSFAIVGRPNVGKSTLVNGILGEDRVVTYDEAGTTRDSINIMFEKMGQHYKIVDTAGIRRRGKVSDKIEKFSVLKAIQAINDVNVVVLVLDAHLDIATQDATIVGYALDAGKAIVVAINKWDAPSFEQKIVIKKEIKHKFHFLQFAKFNYISALKKQGLNELLSSINEAYSSAFKKLSTSKLTRVLLEAVNRQPPSFKGQFRPKLRYAHQGGLNPPIIIIHGNRVDAVSLSYTKYLERVFVKAFNLVGTPIKIEYKVSTNPYDKSEHK